MRRRRHRWEPNGYGLAWGPAHIYQAVAESIESISVGEELVVCKKRYSYNVLILVPQLVMRLVVPQTELPDRVVYVFLEPFRGWFGGRRAFGRGRLLGLRGKTTTSGHAGIGRWWFGFKERCER
jgi:hypothetical protein